MVSGDTLRNIAKETYGNASDYRYIFIANWTKFGISPHVIRIGQILDLPCYGTFTAQETPNTPIEIGASVTEPTNTETVEPEVVEQPLIVEVTPEEPAPEVEPETVAVAEPASKVEPATVAITETDQAPEITVKVEESTPIVAPTPMVTTSLRNITVVGFSDNLPYSDASLLQGGLITTLIETALLRSEATRVDQPIFVKRPDVGLATSVLPDEYHLSFPWLLPDCELAEFDADIKDLCDNYTFSVPIYEAQMAMYTLSDSLFKDAAAEVDLVGARICRPSTMHTYDLLEIGMIEPIISLETGADLAACFDKLQNNIVDIVSVNGLTADVYFADAGRDDQIIELTALVALHTVHAVTSNDNEVGLIALDYLNSGLWDMLANGEWGEISKDYLLNRLN